MIPRPSYITKIGTQSFGRACRSSLSPIGTIDLVYYHEKLVDEVAQVVGISASTVKTRMFYARRHMEKLLAVAGHDGL